MPHQHDAQAQVRGCGGGLFCGDRFCHRHAERQTEQCLPHRPGKKVIAHGFPQNVVDNASITPRPG
ncbi:hypothetical protein [Xanthomonas axonopodis]|uniref:hypothetical protein n=1 Tax=Xanthomonas axonopodis TaxID=53413 RepID=UPI001FD67571|nr:hypothetical protein [Xanthomonas axonopodis]